MKDFAEKYKGLINTDVPREFLRTEESSGMPSPVPNQFPIPKEGFISKYTEEKQTL